MQCDVGDWDFEGLKEADQIKVFKIWLFFFLPDGYFLTAGKDLKQPLNW